MEHQHKQRNLQIQTLGPKVITLLATGANGCYLEIKKEVEVLIQPIADFSVTPNCSGQPIQFINNSKVSQDTILTNGHLEMEVVHSKQHQ